MHADIITAILRQDGFEVATIMIGYPMLQTSGSKGKLLKYLGKPSK